MGEAEGGPWRPASTRTWQRGSVQQAAQLRARLSHAVRRVHVGGNDALED